MADEVELTGWEQIAKYLGVSVRTAQVYERDLSLPVRRLPGAKGRVWACADELQVWKFSLSEHSSFKKDQLSPIVITPLSEPGPSGLKLLPWLFVADPPSGALPKKAVWRAVGYGSAGVLALVVVAIYMLLPHGGLLADFYVQGQNVVAVDAKGRELWRYRFPWELYEPSYVGNEKQLHSWIGDLDGSGKPTLLLATRFYKDADVGTSTFCFRSDGSLRWKVAAGGTVDDVSGSHMTSPYYTNSVQVLTGKTTADTRIVIGSSHHLEQPFQLAFLDVGGRVVGEYWHPGQLLHVNQADLDGDGKEELLLAGVNNGDHQATLVILDPLKIVGAVTPMEMKDRSFSLLNMAAAKEKAVVLFPRSCNSIGEPYTRVESLSVSIDRITVVVAEGPAEKEYPGFIYELDRRLRVIGVQPQGAGAVRRHDELQARGKLDHPFDAARECARLKAGVIVRRGE